MGTSWRQRGTSKIAISFEGIRQKEGKGSKKVRTASGRPTTSFPQRKTKENSPSSLLKGTRGPDLLSHPGRPGFEPGILGDDLGGLSPQVLPFRPPLRPLVGEHACYFCLSVVACWLCWKVGDEVGRDGCSYLPSSMSKPSHSVASRGMVQDGLAGATCGWAAHIERPCGETNSNLHG